MLAAAIIVLTQSGAVGLRKVAGVPALLPYGVPMRPRDWTCALIRTGPMRKKELG